MHKGQWNHFISLWEAESYEDAVKMTLETQARGTRAVIDQLFRKDTSTSAATVSLSFLDIMYDYFMIHPEVINAVDFAREEEVGSFFTFQLFSEGFDLSLAGELTRLKGYTAEQLVALELQGKGHDVSFPSSSNQAGYDLIVDGQPFQVKCLSDPSGVYEHFRKYPDIPVLVNSELMPDLSEHPLVYSTEVSNEIVEEMTYHSIESAAEVGELDIPIITLALSSLSNGYKMLSDGLSMRLAGWNVVNETVSRSVAAMGGKGVGVLIGPVLGPAGVVVMPMFLGLAGAYHGGKIVRHVKRLYTKKEREQVYNDINILLTKVLTVIPEKVDQREETYGKVKKQLIQHDVLKNVLHVMNLKHREKQQYLLNKRNELEEWLSNVDIVIETDLPHILDTVVRSQVHPYLYQQELKKLGESYGKLIRI
ncbi:hypothetical protein [Halobacillus trueperi]|uniref:Uncharacterized protein n=1 Tax=Halobacillus trueperi TaxID=156205 RepID=A0A3E0JBL6_9BACI|nr:hypothetical protein [Halobacillus trueperi]REJ10343.1 hypothetical protein DYE48_06490 [Halobacillus trueperi]